MFVADLVLVLVMVGASAVGAVAVPPNGMLPVDVVPGAGPCWAPKGIALALWPATGLVAYLVVRVSATFGATGLRPEVGLTIALSLMLAAEASSIVVAIRRRGRP